jgi:mono/diheme cytochrome c family protein
MKTVKILSPVLFIVIAMLCVGFVNQDKKPWNVPADKAKVANPVASNAGSIKEGKELWAKHCQSCHGKSGLGDGPKAAQLKTEPGDFSLASTQKQSDGALFYKISEGRDDMPSFKKKIPEAEDIWNVVNYLRTLKK